MYNSEAKQSLLRGDFWVKDDAGLHDNLVFTDVAAVAATGTRGNSDFVEAKAVIKANKGFVQRHNLFADGQVVELCGKVHSDILNSGRFLLNLTDVSLEFKRSDDEFCLLGTDAKDYTIQFVQAYLKVRRVTVSNDLIKEHGLALQSQTAKYPIRRCEIKTFSHTNNTNSFSINVSKGFLPSRLVLFFVDTSAAKGDYKKNPYRLLHLNISEIKLKCAGKFIYEGTGMELNFSQNAYMEGYKSLFNNIRYGPMDISYEDYKNGSTVFAWDLSPDMCDGYHFSVMPDGDLEINIKIGTLDPTVPAVQIFTICEYQNMFELDNTREVYQDYTG